MRPQNLSLYTTKDLVKWTHGMHARSHVAWQRRIQSLAIRSENSSEDVPLIILDHWSISSGSLQSWLDSEQGRGQVG